MSWCCCSICDSCDRYMSSRIRSSRTCSSVTGRDSPPGVLMTALAPRTGFGSGAGGCDDNRRSRKRPTRARSRPWVHRGFSRTIARSYDARKTPLRPSRPALAHPTDRATEAAYISPLGPRVGLPRSAPCDPPLFPTFRWPFLEVGAIASGVLRGEKRSAGVEAPRAVQKRRPQGPARCSRGPSQGCAARPRGPRSAGEFGDLLPPGIHLGIRERDGRRKENRLSPRLSRHGKLIHL